MKNRLREFRTQRGWTQEQVARAVGVSRQAVIALETERHDPSLDLAYRLAAVLETPVETLFENPHRSPFDPEPLGDADAPEAPSSRRRAG